MPRRLLDWDPLTGVATYHHFDPETRMRTIEEVQDVSPIMEANKAIASRIDRAAHRRGDMWLVGKLPFSLAMKWKQEEGVDVINDKDSWRFLERKLRDPEYRYLTTGILSH